MLKNNLEGRGIIIHLDMQLCIDNIPQFSNIQVEECLVRVRRSEGDNLALQELADVEQEGETQQWADVAHLGTVDIVFVCEAYL